MVGMGKRNRRMAAREKWVENRKANALLSSYYIHALRLELTTFAGLQAFKPPVINVSVAGTSTVLKPSTARSATTGSPGLLKYAALWARPLVSNRWSDGCRACPEWRGDYEFSFRYWRTCYMLMRG